MPTVGGYTIPSPPSCSQITLSLKKTIFLVTKSDFFGVTEIRHCLIVAQLCMDSESGVWGRLCRCCLNSMPTTCHTGHRRRVFWGRQSGKLLDTGKKLKG